MPQIVSADVLLLFTLKSNFQHVKFNAGCLKYCSALSCHLFSIFSDALIQEMSVFVSSDQSKES